MSRVIHGDCLEKLGEKVPVESVDLVYMDPPFYTQKDWSEYDDRWESLGAYKEFIREALQLCNLAMKPSATIYVHCDSAANYHIRPLLDLVFGDHCFRNEIVWAMPLRPTGFKTRTKSWVRGHDTIYMYAGNNATFNKQYEPYDAAYVEQHDQEDENGRYKERWGRKLYLKEGYHKTDVWTDIPSMQQHAVQQYEKPSYPTQKPSALLQRIISASSNEGDLVLDPMCGSGTTCVVAKQLGRRYIGIDKNPNAVDLTEQRLQEMLI